MYQRDYILRILEMLSELVSGILGLIQKGDFAKASKSLENAYLDLLEVDAAFFNVIPNENIAEILTQKYNYTNGHFEILCELLFLQAELFYSMGSVNESLNYYIKSKTLLDFVILDSGTYSVYKRIRSEFLSDRIEHIKIGL